jgi:hypothetical protein
MHVDVHAWVGLASTASFHINKVWVFETPNFERMDRVDARGSINPLGRWQSRLYFAPVLYWSIVSARSQRIVLRSTRKTYNKREHVTIFQCSER